MDAVICWVDTSDDTYINQRNIDLGKEKREYSKREDSIRVGKRDELRFCIRGLYYNMPWLRNIYLVTWGDQFPSWLDKKDCAKRKPPIFQIQREILNDGKHMYGSTAVEACIHAIPNLSEYFIYANSDTFVCKPMTHEQWFDNGVGKIVNSPIKFFDPSLKKSQQHWYKYGILSQWKLFKEKFPNPTFEPFIETHQISIFSKQACIDAKNMYPELYDKTLSMKGRVEEDYIGRLLFNYIAIQKGYCIFNKRPPSIAYYSKANLFKPITNVPYLLCTNLNSMMSKKKYTQYMQFMLDIFPKPHPSETYLSYESTCYYRYKDVNMCKNTPILDKKTDTIPKTFFKKGGAYTRKKQIPRRNHTQKKKIALYYSQGHYKNLGDGINPLIFNHFLKHTPTYQNILKAPAHRKIYHILGIGSILSRRTDIDTSAQIVCGSGFIYEDSIPQKPLRIISVRGPLTRQKFLDAGIDCPKVYGDMALLIRYIIKQPLHIQKKFKYGIIPHIVDKEHPFINENAENTSYKIIDIQQSDTPENFVREIHECEAIISSSLHGIIICDSYNIPAHHIKISDKLMGGVWKFKDYYASVGRPYTSIDITQPLTNIVLPAYKVHFDFDSYYTYMKKELGKL